MDCPESQMGKRGATHFTAEHRARARLGLQQGQNYRQGGSFRK